MVTCTRDHVSGIATKFCVSILDPRVLLALPISFLLILNTLAIFAGTVAQSV